VTNEARVTIAYELYRDGLPDPNADALLLRAERCRAAFAKLCADEDFMPEGRLPWLRGVGPIFISPRPGSKPRRLTATRASSCCRDLLLCMRLFTMPSLTVGTLMHIRPHLALFPAQACHLYEEKELSAADKALGVVTAAGASARKIKGLKNEDAVLAIAAKAAGLEVETVRLLTDGESYMDGEFVLATMPKNDRG
jgi:hypothetical protein